jgi:hypothetical protein
MVLVMTSGCDESPRGTRRSDSMKPLPRQLFQHVRRVDVLSKEIVLALFKKGKPALMLLSIFE